MHKAVNDADASVEQTGAVDFMAATGVAVNASTGDAAVRGESACAAELTVDLRSQGRGRVRVTVLADNAQAMMHHTVAMLKLYQMKYPHIQAASSMTLYVRTLRSDVAYAINGHKLAARRALTSGCLYTVCMLLYFYRFFDCYRSAATAPVVA
jgi:hypothetical protein